jgi:ubiquinone/menaquinone biosynthesis C-methylase UbiE
LAKYRKTTKRASQIISDPAKAARGVRKQVQDDDKRTTRKRELIGLYDTTAAIYNRRYKAIQSGKYRYIVGQFGKKDVILDVGCGTGLLLRHLGDKVACIVGVDLSTEMLRVALKDIKKKGIKGNLIRADADTLPFRSDIFTKVASVSLLQNMSDPEATIGEIARVLGAGGVMAITCLRKKYNLPELSGMITSVAPKLKLISEWDSNEEDVGVNATKLI